MGARMLKEQNKTNKIKKKSTELMNPKIITMGIKGSGFGTWELRGGSPRFPGSDLQRRTTSELLLKPLGKHNEADSVSGK